MQVILAQSSMQQIRKVTEDGTGGMKSDRLRILMCSRSSQLRLTSRSSLSVGPSKGGSGQGNCLVRQMFHRHAFCLPESLHFEKSHHILQKEAWFAEDPLRLATRHRCQRPNQSV